MITPELTNYIKERQGQGASQEEIKQSLLSVGWQASDIEEGFNSLEQKVEPIIAPITEPTNKFEQPMTEQSSSLQPKLETVSTQPQPIVGSIEPSKTVPTIETTPQTEQVQPLSEVDVDQLETRAPLQKSTGSIDTLADTLDQISGQPTEDKTVTSTGGDWRSPIFRYVLIALALVVIVFGLWWLWNRLFGSPQKVVQKTMVNLIVAKALEYNGQIQFSAASQVQPNQGTSVSLTSSNAKVGQSLPSLDAGLNFKLDFQGKLDKQNANDPRSDLIVSFDAGSLGIVAFDWRTINKTNYLKLEINRLLESFGLEGFDLSLLKKYWIKVDVDQLMSRLGSPEISQQLKQQTTTNIDAESLVKPIKEAFRKHQIIAVKEKLAAQTINNQRLHHYKFGIDAKELANLISDLQNIKQLPQPSQAQLDQVVEQLKTLETMTGELWIDQKTLLPYRMIGKITDDQSGLILDLDLKFANFNTSQNIETPEPTRSLESIVYLLYKQAAQNQESLGIETSFEDTDQDGLFDVLEPWFGTKKDVADTDSDGYLDGIEVENDYNPLGQGRL